jgi:CHAT domain-containing protein
VLSAIDLVPEMADSPAAALREAQIWMIGQKRWRDPYYWAAFVLQGEWR